MAKPSLVFGIDIGGTKIDVSLVDSSGKIRSDRLITTRSKESPEVVVEDIVKAVNEMRKDENQQAFLGIGVGMAAQIEKSTGLVRFAPNLGWRDFPLQDELSSQLGLPVWVTNDVRAAAWGEWLYGAGRGCSDLLCIFVGTGIGGGIVSDGKMLSGHTNTAGEIGHMTIDLDGPQCSCGNRGCLEAFAGGWAIAKRAREISANDPHLGAPILDLAGGKIELITAKHVFEAYRRQAPAAVKIIEGVKEALIAGVANLVNVLNPQKIIFGGGILREDKEIIEAIREGVPKRALKTPVESLQIVNAELGGKAGAIGAAAYAMMSVSQPEEV